MTPGQIKDARKRLGETAAQFGQRCGVSEATVFKWEGGRKVMPQYEQAVAQALDEAAQIPDTLRPGQEVAERMTQELMAAMERHEPIVIAEDAGGIVYGPHGRERK